LSRVILANRSTFHHLVGELLGKRVGTARPGGSADDLIEHGSHIDIRSARLFAGAHSAQVCSFIGKRATSGVSQHTISRDLFVHHTGIAGGGFRSLPEGAKVSDDATQGPKGPNASNIQTI